MNAQMAPAVVFLPMREADLDEVMVIEAVQYPFPWTRGNFLDSLNAKYLAWTLRSGRMVAYAVVMIVLDEAHLLNLTVARDCERMGHGWSLLDRMAQVARDEGASSMLLEVRPSNDNALRLYRRYGFVAIGRRPAYYPAHGGREDAVVMRVAL
jgi:ribosomal-protein-alanine N-acetyltransferase